MKLPEKLAAFRRNFEAGGPPYNAPADIHPPMHRATAELIASGAAEKALKVGDTAPAFALKDPDGNLVSSQELLAAGPLVITFYRGVWCPYCNMDLQALQEALPKLKELGAQLVAISPQTGPNSRRSRRENKLEFLILSDPGNEVAEHHSICASGCPIISRRSTRQRSKMILRWSTGIQAGRYRCPPDTLSGRMPPSSMPKSTRTTRFAPTRRSCSRRSKRRCGIPVRHEVEN